MNDVTTPATGRPRVRPQPAGDRGAAGQPGHGSRRSPTSPKPGSRSRVCAPQVPCGAAAKKAFAAADVTATPVTQEQDVKAALTKVELGEVDAGAGLPHRRPGRRRRGHGHRFPETAQAITDYPIARWQGAPNPAGAAASSRRCGPPAVAEGADRRRLRPAVRRAGPRRPGRPGRPGRWLGAGLPRPAAGRLLVRAPWRALPRLLARPACSQALRLSLVTATLATAVSLVLGVPLAWVLARAEFPGRRLLRALVTLPLVLPPVVGGVALLLVARPARPGRPAAVPFGLTLPFTTAGGGGRRDVRGDAVPGDQRGGRAARRRPAVRGGRRDARRRPLDGVPAGHAAAGARRAWRPAPCCAGRGRSGEFGATITFAGNFPGATQTMPLAVYLALETDPEAAVALSLVLLAVSVAVLAALRDRWLGAVHDAVGARAGRPRTASRSTSTLDAARRRGASRCSARTAPARRPCCGAGRAGRRSTGGRVALDGAAGRPARHCRAEQRPVGMVFQDYLLFPHLSRAGQRGVRAALPRDFGRGRGARRRPPDGSTGSAWPAAPRRRPRRAVRRPGAAGRAGPRAGRRAPAAAARRAAGGARRPTRLDVRAELRRHLADFAGATVLVTHDPLDAMVLADRIVVVEDGRVVQAARPPRSPGGRGPTTWPGWSGSTSTAAGQRDTR